MIPRDELLVIKCGDIRTTVVPNIFRLRQKWESEPSDPSPFLTMFNLGYKFVPQAGGLAFALPDL